MKIVYISGPISGRENNNAESFKIAEIMLSHRGHQTINPHEVCKHINPNEHTVGSMWNACMRECIKAMMDADTILMLPGFTNSRGALVELELAKQLGMQIIHFENITSL